MILEVSKDKYSEFNKLLKKGNVIVFYYANWCGFCHQMLNEWVKFKSMVKNDAAYKHINVAEIESEHIPNTNAANGQVEGFPTIKFYNEDKDNNMVSKNVVPFEDERVSSKIAEFALKQAKPENNNNTAEPKNNNNAKPENNNNKKDENNNKSKKTKSKKLFRKKTKNNAKNNKSKKSKAKKSQQKTKKSNAKKSTPKTTTNNLRKVIKGMMN